MQHPETLDGFLRLKRMFSQFSSRVFCVIMPEQEWRLFGASYTHSFGGFGLLDADSFASVRPSEIYSYLGDLFFVNQDNSIVIRLIGKCHPIFISLLVHEARRLPLHDALVETMRCPAPPICLWMTPEAYLELEEFRHIIIRSIGYGNVAYFNAGQSTPPTQIEAAIVGDPKLQSHPTVRRHCQLQTEAWYPEFAKTCGNSFPVLDTPRSAVLAAHVVTAWGDSSKRWVFRGQADYRWTLTTTMERGSALEVKHGLKWTKEERLDLLRQFVDFIARQPKPELQAIVGRDRQIEALAQHHGLPTHLLDFSYNPYVATLFASAPTSPFSLGCLYCINLKEYNEFLDPSSALKEVGLARNTPPDHFRRQFPEMAMPDCLPIELPKWEKRMTRQEGLFLDGSNLKLVLHNIIDRYYFKRGAFYFDPEWCGVDLQTLFDDEPWLEAIISQFAKQYLGTRRGG